MTFQADLCTPGQTFRLKNGQVIRFTCDGKHDGVTSFICTGSSHIGGDEIECTCDCHEFFKRDPETPCRCVSCLETRPLKDLVQDDVRMDAMSQQDRPIGFCPNCQSICFSTENWF